jgi:4-amino-4-deoxy-L-arabinose transferase-like glycosyltransferase
MKKNIKNIAKKINTNYYTLLTIILIVLMAIFSSIHNAFIPIHFDEAYYWWMSKHLSLGYFDIPPMLTYLIKAFSFLGDNTFAIRLTNVFCLSLGFWFLYLITKTIYSKKVAFYCVLFVIFLPSTTIGYTITTTDSPFLLTFFASVYFGLKIVFCKNNKKNTKYFIVLGFVLACGIASKYSILIVGASLFLYALLHKRNLFKNRNIFYLIASFIIFSSPFIYWHIVDNFEAFIFRYYFGSPVDASVNLEYVLNFFVSFFALFTPIFFIAFIYYFYKAIKYKGKIKVGKKEYYIFFIAFFFIIYFFYKSFFRNIELNWLVPPVILLFPFLSYYILKHKKIAIFAFLISFCLSLLVRFPYILPQELNLQNNLNWYKQASELIIKTIKNENMKKNNLAQNNNINICADYYSTASLLQYYIQTNPTLKSDINFNILEPLTPNRKSDISIWSGNDYSKIKNCFIITRGEFSKKKQNYFCKKIIFIKKFSYKIENKKTKSNTNVGYNYHLYKCQGLINAK